MRAPRWYFVVGVLTWFASLALAQPPGGGPTGPQKPPQQGFPVGWRTFVVLGAILLVVFIAGAVAKMRKNSGR